MAERPFDVARRAGPRRRAREPGPRRERPGALGLVGDPPDRPRRRHRSDARSQVRLPRRRQRRRPHPRLGSAAAARRPGRDARLSGGLGSEVPARRRADRLEGRLPPRRAVVSEARRGDGRRLERPPVPRGHRILCGLRRLRRLPHAPEGEQGPRRRDRRPQGGDRDRGRPRARAIRRRGRPRLRVRSLPALRGRARHVQREGSPERRHRPPSAARPPPSPGPIPQGDEGRARGLRDPLSRVSLPRRDGRRPAVGQPHGGNGVPDSLRGRRPGARAEEGPLARERDDPRIRPPGVLRDARLERGRGGAPRRGLQHVRHDEGARGRVRPPVARRPVLRPARRRSRA